MKDPTEIARIRVSASKYAQKFLRQKYRTEYQELYDAYLRNRGLNTRRHPAELVDEREVQNS
jgi:hypothetical protein